MVGQVARALAGLDAAGLLRGQFAGVVIDGIDHDLVEAEVGGEGVFAIGGDEEGVGVRLFLPRRIDRGALVLYEVGGFAERSIRVDGQDGDAAAAVVGDKGVAAGGIDIDVAGAAANRRLGVDVGEGAGLRVDAESGDRAAGSAIYLAGLADGIEVAVVGSDGDEGGRVNAVDTADGAEGAAGHVEAVDVDTGLVGFGVGADIDEIIAHGGGLLWVILVGC